MSVSEGDWTCGDSDCHHVNFARRTQCNKCHRERSPELSSGSSSTTKKKLGTEIGKAAAEKSRGLFSAEDWQCSKCANVNWARRQTCNMCNAPKFTDVEERTGYGGGYNDRGVVEYKERSESDSEYDEFGRLKKRKTKTDSGNSKSTKSEKEDNDDDDEDEDDGDGDLSKYDLWGDDVAVTVAGTTKNSNIDNVQKTNARNEKSTTTVKKARSSSSSSSSSSTSSSSTTSSSSSSQTSSSSRSSHSRSRRRQRSLSRDKNKQHSRSNSLKSSERRHRSRERSKTHSQQSHTSSRKSGRKSRSGSPSSSRSSTSAKRKTTRDAIGYRSRSPHNYKRTRSRSSSAGKQRR